MEHFDNVYTFLKKFYITVHAVSRVALEIRNLGTGTSWLCTERNHFFFYSHLSETDHMKNRISIYLRFFLFFPISSVHSWCPFFFLLASIVWEAYPFASKSHASFIVYKLYGTLVCIPEKKNLPLFTDVTPPPNHQHPRCPSECNEARQGGEKNL